MKWFRLADTGGEPHEKQLLQRVAQGDQGACRLLCQRHLGRVVSFAQRMLNDPMEAEDVAQEALLRLWKAADQWRSEAKVDTWLHRVAYNLCMDRLRQHRESLPGELPEMEDETPSPLARLHHHQVSHVVQTALAQLPSRQRAAIVLVHYQESTGREAAKILGIGVEALESLLARGRKRLREILSHQRLDLLGGEK